MIKGQVRDDSYGLPAANVDIKGTDKGTICDFDGHFSIEATKGDVLVFSYVGFVSREIIVGDNPLNITLKLDEDIQGEIIVVGGATFSRAPKKLFYKNPFLYRRWFR